MVHDYADFEDAPPPAPGLAVGIALATAVLAVVFRFVRAHEGTDWFADDAYYYAVIARRLAETGRATFDGITPTNGFHPLLLWLEAAGYRLFGTTAGPVPDYLALVAATGAVFLATCVAGMVAAYRSGRAWVLFGAALVVATLAQPRFASIFLDGMESVLVLPLLALVLALAFRRRHSAAGLCAAGLVLARLDTLPFVVVPLALACVLREARAGRPAARAALLLLGPSALAVAAFVLGNLREFGHPLPISGSLKSTFPRIHFQPMNFFGNAEEQLGLRAAVLGAVLGAALLALPGRLPSETRAAGLVAAALALGQALVLALFEKWSKDTPAWYLAATLPLGTTAFALGLAHVLAPRALARTAAVLAGLALALQLAWISGRAGRLGPPFARTLPFTAGVPNASRELIARAIATPPETVWASTDCGLWAFWSRRTFINLDGLVNDFAYQDRLRAKKLGQYLNERRVRYLVLGVWNMTGHGIDPVYRHRAAPALFAGTYEEASFFLYSHHWDAWSERVELPRRAEIWRSPPFPDGPRTARLVVFDLSRR